MSSLRELPRRVRSRLGKLRRRSYYKNPASYWENRHQRFGKELGGVGTLGLDEPGNQLDYDTKWEHVQTALQTIGATGGDVLDAGCGNGWFTVKLRDAGFHPRAVDFSPSAAALARDELGPDVQVDVSALDDYRAGRQFPLVVCIDVLFHVTDDDRWAASVANLASHVETGGHLLVQDQLVERAEAPIDPAARHTRWRTLDAYLGALPGWDVVLRDHYDLPGEGKAKDLVVYARG